MRFPIGSHLQIIEKKNVQRVIKFEQHFNPNRIQGIGLKKKIWVNKFAVIVLKIDIC